MKLRYKIALAVTLVFAVFLFLSSQVGEDLKDSFSKYFQIEKKESIEKTTSTTIQTKKLNQTEESNYSIFPEPETEERAERALTLEIVDICSGKLSLLTVSEGAVRCLNKKFPYYVIIKKNSTHLKTSLQGEDFEEIYDLNDSILIFFIFAEDVATVSHEIQSLSLEGGEDFYIGDYYLHTVWERGASGNLEISKMLVAIPLYVNSNITSSEEWKELKFYLNIPNKTYYLGNLFVLVK